MARRVSLPAAEDLFRPTAAEKEESVVRAVPDAAPNAAPNAAPEETGSASAGAVTGAGTGAGRGSSRRTSGRVRHDEKMTVYITSDELLDLEHARLSLRRSHGLAVDRGRIVREAVAMVLADLESHGPDSALVRRLTEE